MNLYLTATGQYAGTQKDAGKGHTPVEVPTDKAGLLAYLNGLTRPEDATPVEAPESLAESLPAPEVPMEADGHPVAYTAFTRAQVDGMFRQTPEALRELLHRISKLSFRDLGYVAFEVGYRYSKQGIAA